MTEPNAQDAPSGAPPKSRWFGRLLIRLVLLAWAGIALVGLAGGVLAFVVYDYITQPGIAGPAVTVTIPSGATGQEIAGILKDADLVEYETLFMLAMRIDGSDRSLRSGVYEMPRGLSPMQLLHLLHEGPARPLQVDRRRITIPEGLAIQQMVEMFETEEEQEAFLEAVRSPALLARLGIEAETLEGFLMPNTYFFDDDPEPFEIVERMVVQFERDYQRLLDEIPGAGRYDKMYIVTVASLVEKEARDGEERPLVAAVIYNRLDQNMHLGLDATLQFALNKYGQRMLNVDKEVDSPYNTYRNRGLPPGPIANPGVASLRAAMRPAQADYLYFVSNADGWTHTFSRTLREHQRAVERYRREIAVQRAELERRQREAERAEQTR